MRKSCHYIGVSYHKATRYFRANISTGGVRRFLGTFSTATEAARQYDAAALQAGRPGNFYGKSKHRGVTWDHRARKWVARIVIITTYYTLGSFLHEKDAALKYDEVAARFGRPTNFGLSPANEICAEVMRRLPTTLSAVQEVTVKVVDSLGILHTFFSDLVVYVNETTKAPKTALVVVELDERHHFRKTRWSASQCDEILQSNLGTQQEHDRLKDKAARDKEISTLHVHYNQYPQGADIILEFIALTCGQRACHGVTNPAAYLPLLPAAWHADLLRLGP